MIRRPRMKAEDERRIADTAWIAERGAMFGGVAEITAFVEVLAECRIGARRDASGEVGVGRGRSCQQCHLGLSSAQRGAARVSAPHGGSAERQRRGGH